MRLGLIGGTFDPVHLGHLIGAQTASSQLALDKVLLVPAAAPPHKTTREITPAKHRAAMLKMALEGNPQFALCLEEIERGGASFTVDTVRTVRKTLAPGDELFFILGADNLVEFTTWKNWPEILQNCRLAALRRPGCRENKFQIPEELKGEEIIMVRMPLVEISSTGIRRDVARGVSVRYRVPTAVLRYIDSHGLYRSSRKVDNPRLRD